MLIVAVVRLCIILRFSACLFVPYRFHYTCAQYPPWLWRRVIRYNTFPNHSSTYTLHSSASLFANRYLISPPSKLATDAGLRHFSSTTRSVYYLGAACSPWPASTRTLKSRRVTRAPSYKERLGNHTQRPPKSILTQVQWGKSITLVFTVREAAKEGEFHVFAH